MTVFADGNANATNSSTTLANYFNIKLNDIYRYGIEQQSKLLEQEQTYNFTKRKFLLQTENATLVETTVSCLGIWTRWNKQSLVPIQIWNVQTDKSKSELHIIYYVHKNGILVPYEDASQIMTFVSDEYIYNSTGYRVIHKVKRKTFDQKQTNS